MGKTFASSCCHFKIISNPISINTIKIDNVLQFLMLECLSKCICTDLHLRWQLWFVQCWCNVRFPQKVALYIWVVFPLKFRISEETTMLENQHTMLHAHSRELRTTKSMFSNNFEWTYNNCSLSDKMFTTLNWLLPTGWKTCKPPRDWNIFELATPSITYPFFLLIFFFRPQVCPACHCAQ